MLMSKKDFHHEHLTDVVESQSYMNQIYWIKITTVKKTKASEV